MDLEECAVYDCNHGKQYYPGWLVDDFKNNVCNKQCPAADKNVSYYCGPDDLLSSQRPKFQAYGGVQELRGPAGVTSREITWHRGPRHHLKLHYAVVLAEEQHVVNLDDVEEIWRITCPAEDAQRMELDLISSREATTLREHFLSLLRSYQSLVVAGSPFLSRRCCKAPQSILKRVVGVHGLEGVVVLDVEQIDYTQVFRHANVSFHAHTPGGRHVLHEQHVRNDAVGLQEPQDVCQCPKDEWDTVSSVDCALKCSCQYDATLSGGCSDDPSAETILYYCKQILAPEIRNQLESLVCIWQVVGGFWSSIGNFFRNAWHAVQHIASDVEHMVEKAAAVVKLC
ncbi:hypothetical protein AK812_SmicGene35294 [Symbiodinium microadriaticum]|uniref:Uncharacterized protein n=1 Tax=Symbiodinium microadriaticum TaxID=2951 RepID=A0A1Q9CLU1_SYMMI|nr:hypothetical protein AK812_SmicGene35294 [Symbiodinium microadriaticum]CAE7557956.1 unnamed protein product [Symbiodinium microadriaticum]